MNIFRKLRTRHVPFSAFILSLLSTNVVFAQQFGPNAQLVMDTMVNIVRFLTVGVGAVLVLMFGWAGFRYLSARDNASQVSEAKMHMYYVILALFLYLFGFALLNWLLPGGIVGIRDIGGGR